MGTTADDLLAAIRADIDQTAEVLLTTAERGLNDVAAAKAGDCSSLDRLEQAFTTLLETCAFHDLVGQRLTSLEAEFQGRSAYADPLLNGPALAGEGLDQAAADALFESTAP
ncbi:hypothetical protein [Brucella anthropi]|uniref:hypothetical protein n=1 Tax=Brucella anthropi TaxID=529 RepID=UPI002157EB57|nr:hypothetical protein [Brucella anthropi]MCR8493064.1 hypothetical protein [Brucella anthropi]